MHPLHHASEPTRRDFVAALARTCLGVRLVPPMGLAQAFAASASGTGTKSSGSKASHVISLFMRGGMSHVDTFDTKPDAPSGIQGPVRTIDTKADGLRLSHFFEKLADHGPKLAVIRSMSHNQGAHELGVHKMLTGYEKSPSVNHPALGAWVARFVPVNGATLPPFIRLGSLSGHPGSGFMDARFAPVPVTDPAKGIEHTQQPRGDSKTALRKRTELAAKIDAGFRQRFDSPEVRAHAEVYADAVKLMSSKDLNAFRLDLEEGKMHDAYGRDAFGQGVLLARRLVEHGTKFVEVDLGSWDTHSDNFRQVEQLTRVLDRTMDALLTDLEERGLLESTLVMVTTEFGRSPKLSGDGRDHHPVAFSAMLAGGGVRGGQAYGKTDEVGHHVIEGKVSVLDLHATVGALLGIGPEQTVQGGAGGGLFTIGGGTGAKRGQVIAPLV